METMKTKIRGEAWLIAFAVVVITLVIAGFLLLAIYSDAGPGVAFFLVWMAVPFLLAADAMRAARKRRVGVVLAHLEEAVRMNLPLPEMMLAAAESEGGVTRRRLLSVRDRLVAGQALGPALYYGVPEMPASTARAVNAADAIGRLPQMLRRQVKHALPREPRIPQVDRFYRGYAIFTCFFLVTGICFLMSVVVFPKFNSMLAAFGGRTPLMTQLVESVSQVYLPVVVAVALLLLLVIWWGGTARDYLVWHLPVIGGTASDRGMADLCAFLADALDAGQPLDEALWQAADGQPSAVLRHRIRRWASRLERGEAAAEAARRSGMPSLLVGMLNTTSGDDLPQVMTFLARNYEFRFSRLREVLRAAAIPAIVGVMGLIVLCVDLAVFQPLMTLVNGVAFGGHHLGGF